MAYYIPLSEKVGGRVPRVPHLIAPMVSIVIEPASRCNSRHRTCSAHIPNKVVHFNIHTKFFSDWTSKADF